MNEIDPKDAQVEAMIRDHLGLALDRHVGAASRRFAEEVGVRDRVIPMPARMKQRRTNHDEPKFGSLWSIGLVGAALAATITIFSLRHTTTLPTAKISSPPSIALAPKQNSIPEQ